MDWKTLLKERGVLVSDGAWGTELARAGLGAGTAPELWNIERPQAVEAVARSYVEAGSDIILTNTFGGNRWKLAKSGLGDRTGELNERGTAISKRAAGETALVFASIGPTGEFMAPLGTRGEEEFIACFAEQMEACVRGGADGLVIETMAALEEAMAALRASREAAPGLPAVVSMTYSLGATGFKTMMGVGPEQAAEALERAGADLVGSNCGSGTADMIEVVRHLRAKTSKPIWAKANAGMPKLVDGRTVFPETPEEMAGRVPELIRAGANVIGGCCGTTPAHIRAIVEAVRKHGAR